MRHLSFALLALLTAILFAAPGSAVLAQDATGNVFSREVIRQYDARVAVQPDGSVLVTEDIEVVALGKDIRRGIYRDIPLGGTGLLGVGRASFQLVQTLRDGQPERNRIERGGAAVRIYLGDADVFLDPGVHRYRIVYRMSDQVRRFDGFDEIYWNVTGNDWAFPIEHVRAVVVPPSEAPVSRLDAYTGARGERGEDVAIGENRNGEPLFRATRTLGPGEGLTVAVGWPPGFVAAETGSQRAARWLERWGPFAAAGLTLAIVLLYYLIVWYHVGRDPRGGPIVPVYHPEMPPAAMRSVERMGFDYTCLAAAIVSLAVKGHLKIKEAARKQTLAALPDADAKRPMSDGEAALYDALFQNGEEIAIERTSRSRLDAASAALRSHFRKTYDRIYFRRNFGWFALGVIVTILGWFASALISVRQTELLVVAIFPTVFAVILGTVFVKAWRSLRDYRNSHSIAALIAACIQVGVAGIMVIALGAVFIGLGAEIGLVPFLTLIAIALLNVVFWNLLKVRTAIGRKAMDEIEGTRLYLTVAEKDRLRFESPPDKTPEHFHELLPYAIALDVETDWTDQFAAEIAAAHASKGSDPYLKPGWYSGSRGSGFRDAGALRSIGSSLGGAYGSATVSRSSGSSGSSGGGSSGGGGGGGGGAGW